MQITCSSCLDVQAEVGLHCHYTLQRNLFFVMAYIDCKGQARVQLFKALLAQQAR